MTEQQRMGFYGTVKSVTVSRHASLIRARSDIRRRKVLLLNNQQPITIQDFVYIATLNVIIESVLEEDVLGLK